MLKIFKKFEKGFYKVTYNQFQKTDEVIIRHLRKTVLVTRVFCLRNQLHKATAGCLSQNTVTAKDETGITEER